MTFISQLNWRYATKKFDGTPVPQEKVDQILEAIRLAPTSFGLQPFHVKVITDPVLKAKLGKKAYGQPQFASASHVLVFFGRSDVAARVDDFVALMTGGNAEARAAMKGYEDMMHGSVAGKSQEDLTAWVARQVYIALGFGLAACAELAVDACPMEGFDPKGFEEVLGTPSNMFALVTMPIGYRDASEAPRPKVRFGKDDLFS